MWLTDVSANDTSSTRSYEWTAETIAGFSNDVPMHVRLFNPADKDCNTCTVQSEDFFITGATKTNSSGSADTASPSATHSAAVSTSDIGLALGVGLGLGIPLAVAITSVVMFCCLPGRWREPQIHTADPYEAPLTAWKQPAPTSEHPQAPSEGYYSGQVQKASQKQHNRAQIGELQPELMRVEAPKDTERIELDANGSTSDFNR